MGGKDLLPPVFPIVLYNGKGNWTASLELSEIIEESPIGLRAYRPNLRYFLLDEIRIEDEFLNHTSGTLSEIIRLEKSTNTNEVREIVGRLTESLKHEKYTGLRRALTVWINRVIIKGLSSQEKFCEATELKEINNMLAETVEQWTRDWMQQGMQRGAGKLLLRQVKRRFGCMPKWVEEKITGADESMIEQWADNILDVDAIEDVFR